MDRFIRDEVHDLRTNRGDAEDCDAWIDRNPRWDQSTQRFFPLGINPNIDSRYLND